MNRILQAVFGCSACGNRRGHQPACRYRPAAISDAYLQGHKDRYRRDRQADVLCVHCGKPWAR